MNQNPIPPVPAQTRRIAFLGLGVMGYPMAGHLRRAGHTVTVYNRTAEKAARWLAEHGPTGNTAEGREAEAAGEAGAAASAATPREAADEADIVCACVGNDEDLRSVVLGNDGAFAGMKADAVFVDHTTASAAVARELHAAARARGLHFIDAPVSGGEAGAVNGVLTIMCGGDEGIFARVQPILMAYARACTRIGECGAGQLAKMVNQIAIAGLLQSLAEAIAFGRTAGLDMKLVLDVISKGAAQSWQMEHRGPTMIDERFDFGFAVDWMRKDLGLCLDEARRNGASLPLAALVDQFYSEVQQMGGGRQDTSSLIRRLSKPGLSRPDFGMLATGL